MSMTFLDSIQQLEKVFLDLERVELATVVEQLLQVLIEIFED